MGNEMAEKDEPDLDAAYAVRTPAENRDLYARWAGTYDSAFVEETSYILHAQVAEIYAGHAEDEDVPILDVGVGTGLVGEALAVHGSWPIDGIDISPEMLERARDKGVYSQLTELDLSEPLPRRLRNYGAIVSSGTFTHGHLGPNALAPLLDASRPGALFVISINAEHFETADFSGTFQSLEGMIMEPMVVEVPIYAAPAGTEHDDDRAFIAVFRRL